MDQTENEGRRLGKMRITAEILRQCLRLPQDVKFLNYRASDYSGAAGVDIECIIEADGLDCVPDGKPIPNVTPWLKTEKMHFDDNGVVVDVVKFDRWY